MGGDRCSFSRGLRTKSRERKLSGQDEGGLVHLIFERRSFEKVSGERAVMDTEHRPKHADDAKFMRNAGSKETRSLPAFLPSWFPQEIFSQRLRCRFTIVILAHVRERYHLPATL